MNNIIPFSAANLTESCMLLADTCFILNLLGFDIDPLMNNNIITLEKKRNSQRLVVNITESGSMFALCTVAKQELRDILTRDAFSRRYGLRVENDIKRFKEHDPSAHKKVLEQSRDDFNQLMKALKQIESFYPEIQTYDNSILDRAMEMQPLNNIAGLPDAIQLAIAEANGFDYFITVDKDFTSATLPGVGILVDDHTYNTTTNKTEKGA